MKKYRIKVNDKVYEVEMEEITGEEATTIVESEKQNPVNTEPKSAPEAPVAGGTAVDAPMPGTIVSIAVKPGDKVKTNQLLLVLEAMKMENEIVSPAEGTVLTVNVTKGQTVNPGDSLVQIG